MPRLHLGGRACTLCMLLVVVLLPHCGVRAAQVSQADFEAWLEDCTERVNKVLDGACYDGTPASCPQPCKEALQEIEQPCLEVRAGLGWAQGSM